MNSAIQSYLSWGYLVAVATEPIFVNYLLYFCITIILLVISIAIYLKFKKRISAYRDFDRRWFWGYLTLSLIGLFIWFSADQNLPNIGSRLAVILWIFSIITYGLYLFLYYKKQVSKDLEKYFAKKRKEKYFKR